MWIRERVPPPDGGVSSQAFLPQPASPSRGHWYRPGDCYFHSPRAVRRGHAPVVDTLVGRLVDGSLMGAAEGFFHRGEPGMLAGAIHFDPGSESRLGVYREGAQSPAAPLVQAPTPGAKVVARHATPDAAAYRRAVRSLVDRVHRGELDKAVLGRVLTLECVEVIDPAALLGRLIACHPQAHCFAVPVDPSATGQSPTLVGASPELLVARRGRDVFAHPMAGSRPRSPDATEDNGRARALLGSPKDLHEHRLVIDAVAASLEPLVTALHVPAAPTLVQTPTMWHLATPIRGRLRSRHTTALDLAAAMHPTPAVCGTPRATALSAVRSLEGADRGPFAGAVGYCDGRGDGEWAVAIRCAEVHGRRARLFAGAGIVAGSSPAQEYAETRAKLRTMLHALGLDQETGD